MGGTTNALFSCSTKKKKKIKEKNLKKERKKERICTCLAFFKIELEHERKLSQLDRLTVSFILQPIIMLGNRCY